MKLKTYAIWSEKVVNMRLQVSQLVFKIIINKFLECRQVDAVQNGDRGNTQNSSRFIMRLGS